MGVLVFKPSDQSRGLSAPAQGCAGRAACGSETAFWLGPVAAQPRILRALVDARLHWRTFWRACPRRHSHGYPAPAAPGDFTDSSSETTPMTCLVFPSVSQPGDDGDQSSPSSGLALVMINTALEQLRQRWDALGFDGSVFLAGSDLQSKLDWLRPDQRRDLLAIIVQLCEEPRHCRELQAVIVRGGMDPTVGRFTVRMVATIQTVLSIPPLRVSGFDHRRRAGGQAGDAREACDQNLSLLGLSIRTENALRRNRLHQISDLAGLQDWQLLSLRTFGDRALREVRDGLERLGLPFPLPLDQAVGVTPAAPPVEAIAAAVPPFSGRWGAQPQPLPIDEAEDQRWLERATALIDAAVAEGQRPQRVLDDLTSLTVEHFSALAHRSAELNQLLTIFQVIEVAGSGHDDRQLLAEGLQGVLLEAYRQRCGSADSARAWLRQLLRAVEPARAIPAYLRHAAGESIQGIAASTYPPISRDVVRTSFQKLSTCIDCSPKELAQRMAGRREERERQRLRTAVETWLQTLGRLPFHTDDSELLAEVEALALPKGAKPVTRLSLNQRLHLYEALSLEIPEAEWDLHLRVIVNNEEEGGVGYWQRQEALRAFLHRYAVLLGTPGVMPKQKQLPPAPRGAVQRHGGQSAVARAVELTYQGQLVGENGGRTYWTEERLSELLAQTVVHHGLAEDTLPNRAQIQAFMASGMVPDYLDKQSNSAIAAMSRQSTLSWEQIAERFGRVWRG